MNIADATMTELVRANSVPREGKPVQSYNFPLESFGWSVSLHYVESWDGDAIVIEPVSATVYMNSEMRDIWLGAIPDDDLRWMCDEIAYEAERQEAERDADAAAARRYGNGR